MEKRLLCAVLGLFCSFLVGGALNSFGFIITLGISATVCAFKEFSESRDDNMRLFSGSLFFGLFTIAIATNQGLAEMVKFFSGFSSLFFN